MIFLSRLVPRVRFVLKSKNDHWSKWSEGGVFWILYIKHGTRKTAFRARYDYRDLREKGPWHPKIENRNSELLSRKAEFWLPIVDFSIWVINHFRCPWKMIFCVIKYCLEKFGDVGRAAKTTQLRPRSTSDIRVGCLNPSKYCIIQQYHKVHWNSSWRINLKLGNKQKKPSKIFPIAYEITNKTLSSIRVGCLNPSKYCIIQQYHKVHWNSSWRINLKLGNKQKKPSKIFPIAYEITNKTLSFFYPSAS